MEDMLKRLEAQVKALQGQVNILTAEKEDLRRQVDRLTNEKMQLQQKITQLTNEKAELEQRVTQLTDEKAQLTQQNQSLQARNQELEQENRHLKAQLAQKRPLSLMARADDQLQSIDLVTIPTNREEKGPSPMFKSWLEGKLDFLSELRLALLNARGVAFGVLSDLPAGAELKLYVRFSNRPELRRATEVQCAMLDDIRYGPPMKIGKVTLSPERIWSLVGTITIDKNIRPSFKEATAEEREAEWMSLTGSTPPPTPTPTPTPSDAERAAAEAQRAAYEAQRVKMRETHKKFSQLMRMPIADESGKNEAEILQLTEELLRDLPPRDHLRDEVQFRRERALAIKARREHQSPTASPSPNGSVSPPRQSRPAPAPTP
jgi:cell division protein FtsB